jgi:hypothetical protein
MHDKSIHNTFMHAQLVYAMHNTFHVCTTFMMHNVVYDENWAYMQGIVHSYTQQLCMLCKGCVLCMFLNTVLRSDY